MSKTVFVFFLNLVPWPLSSVLSFSLYLDESTCVLYINANTMPVKKREHSFVLDHLRCEI
jgi:hypothetical protein